MKPILIAGTTIVMFALICYSVGIITEQRKYRITSTVVRFLTLGVIFDISATICMIIGSEKGWISLHGVIGYSSLIAMATDTIMAWRHRLTYKEEKVPGWLHQYSRYAYLWWIIAFITGGLLVAISRS